MMSCGRITWLVIAVVLSGEAFTQRMHDCPLGWVSFGDHCYNFVFYPTQPYEIATTACEQDGAYVLSVNTEAEHEFVSEWLTRHELNRGRRWWTSGSGGVPALRWEGDGTSSSLDPTGKWVETTVIHSDTMYVVYAFTTMTNTFLWARQYYSMLSPYICEISKQESFRIHQAQRDFTYGTNLTDPEVAPKGPRFTVIPEPVVIVDRMESAYLECDADSNPPATYTWYKVNNNSPATKITTSMDTRYSLTNGRFSFQHPQEKLDAGLYYCVAQNQFGSIKTHPVRVSFGYIGDFSNDPPGAVRVNQYQGTYIDCNPPRYNPDASYAWFKGPGANFLRTDLNTYQFVSYNGRLYFSETQLADAGKYHCVVTLAVRLGEQASTVQPPSRTNLGIELIIRGDTATDFGPHIHNDFPAVFPTPALRGEKLRLECLAYGRMPLKYSWSRDNGPIPEKASYTEEYKVLIIPDAQLEDSGNYTCNVQRSNKAQANKTLSVQVEAAPFFMFPLRDQHVDINTQVSMRCEAGGVPRPTYSWFKDGQPLTSQPGDVEVTVNVVVIRHADPLRHSGMYECQASNMYGTRLSSAQLRILSFAPYFEKRPVDDSQMATVGGNTTIICQPEASPLPEITWFHNGAPMNLERGEEGRVMLLENGNLVITAIQVSDQGHYTCTAENVKGKASSTGFLNVVTQTTITVPPHDTHVDVNNTAFLQCQASFDPKHHDVVYFWAFNGFPIDTDHDPTFRMSLLHGAVGLYVINTQFEHDGEYTCTAISVDDSASASAYLTVQGPPSEPAGVHGYMKNMEVHLLWTPGSNHGADILFYNIEYMSLINPEWRTVYTKLWATEIIDVDYPDKCSYSISDLSPGSSYSFRVTAVNRYGPGVPSQPSHVIKIPDAPPRKAPEEIAITFSTAGTLAFMWTELSREDLTGNGVGYKMYWRKKSEDIVRDGLWQTDRVYGRVNSYYTFVGGENFYTPYEVKVAAFNGLGDGPNSTVFVIMSAEDLPIAAPSRVHGVPYNGTAIMVDWNPMDKSRKAIRGKIMGYQINYWWEKDPGMLMSSNVWCEDCVSSLVIGLLPDESYWVNIQVFNVAGLGPKSEDYFIATPLWPPLKYPEYVSVSSLGPHSVFVQWRGVRIGPKEEGLFGYKLWWWKATENIRSANISVVNGYRQTTAVIEGIQEGIVYVLRVLGFSYAGDGKKAPPVFFTLEGMVIYNPLTTEIIAGSSHVTGSWWIFLLMYLTTWLIS